MNWTPAKNIKKKKDVAFLPEIVISNTLKWLPCSTRSPEIRTLRSHRKFLGKKKKQRQITVSYLKNKEKKCGQEANNGGRQATLCPQGKHEGQAHCQVALNLKSTDTQERDRWGALWCGLKDLGKGWSVGVQLWRKLHSVLTKRLQAFWMSSHC